MADPDLQIRGGGEGGHPDPEIGGEAPKNFFWPFGSQFGQKIRGAPGYPGPSSRSATAFSLDCVLILLRCWYWTLKLGTH